MFQLETAANIPSNTAETGHLSTKKSQSAYTTREILRIIEEITRMDNSEHEQIFQIIKKHGCRFTENLNGVFVNLAHVSPSAIGEMCQIIRFWKDQKQHIDCSEQVRTSLVGSNLQDADEMSLSEQFKRSGLSKPASSSASSEHTVSAFLHQQNDSSAMVSNDVSSQLPLADGVSLDYNKTPQNTQDGIHIENHDNTISTESQPHLMGCDPSRPVISKKKCKDAMNNTAELHVVEHRAAHVAKKSRGTNSVFNETTSIDAILSESEVSLIRGETSKKPKLGLHKTGKSVLKNGGSAMRIAKKCMANEDERS